MKQKAFKWFDAHQLTAEGLSDYNYLEDLLENFQEAEECELKAEEVVDIISSYQAKTRKKLG